MSVIFNRGPAEVQGNLTPMIDMTFLLIVFFVLVSRIVDREAVDMNLPQPKHSVSEKAGEERRVIINVVPGEAGGGRVTGYRVGGTEFPATPAGLNAMTAHLTALYQRQPGLDVNVRADRGAQYEFVEPVLGAISSASRAARNLTGAAINPRVNLVVLQEK